MSELFATPNLEVRWAKMVGDAEPNKEATVLQYSA